MDSSIQPKNNAIDEVASYQSHDEENENATGGREEPSESIIQLQIELNRRIISEFQVTVKNSWKNLDSEERESMARYRPLVRALFQKNVKAISDFVDQNLDNVLVDRIEEFGATIFNFIFSVPGTDEIIKKLISNAPEKSLKIHGPMFKAAIHTAAEIGNTKFVKMILEKYKDLLVFKNNSGALPIDMALSGKEPSTNRDTIEYLLSAHYGRQISFEDEFPEDCARVFYQLLVTNRFDLAFDFFTRYSKLTNPTANIYWKLTLQALAEKDMELPHGIRQRLIYHYIPLNVTKQDHVSDHEKQDLENQLPTTQKANLFERFKLRFWSMLISLVAGTKNMYNRKLRHEKLSIMTRRMIARKGEDPEEAYDLLKEPMLTAAKSGNYVLVDEVLKAYHQSCLYHDEHGHTAFHLAVLYRHANVFNLIHSQVEYVREMASDRTDETQSTLLHIAAKLVPSVEVPGAVVEDVLHPKHKLTRNLFEKTAKEVFIEEHEVLLKDGEKWTCSVVAALIITVIFSTTYTFPGGINDKGRPNFLHMTCFKIFLISIALALFSSTGILTSRYAEEDFLVSLPKKLIMGLVTLFFSIGSMMVAFATTFYIYLHEWVWVTSTMVVLVFLVVTLFAFMQFPLFVDILRATFYGDGIFKRLR